MCAGSFISQRMIRLVEGDAHMGARGVGVAACCAAAAAFGAAALGAAGHATRRAAHAAHDAGFERKHGTAAQGDE